MKRMFTLATAVALIAALAVPAGAQAPAEHTATNATITSFDETAIAITVFQPAGASAEAPVPVVLHSHGWAGTRETEIGDAIKAFLDAGFGVVSIDQRGHGDSGGEANVHDPEFEGKDNIAVVDYVTALDWVARDLDDEGNPIADDPALGAIGGSYGGGYQFLSAFVDESLRDEGTRFDVLAPEITWHHLPTALAPNGVVRTAWISALYAVGAPMVAQYIHEAFALGAASGQWPDGTIPTNPALDPRATDLNREFGEHSPSYWVGQGIQLDIPMLFRQGITDNLFNLNEGLHNFESVLTPEAREESLFVGYNGGHVLPNAAPLGFGASGDPCSGNFTNLTIEFFTRAFAGESTSDLLPAQYNLATAGSPTGLPGETGPASRCLSVDELGDYEKFDIEDPAGLGGWGTPTGPAPVTHHIELKDGPFTVAGIARLSGDLYAPPDARAFFALSVGTNAADAQVVQNNMMPLRAPLTTPSIGSGVETELPGVAVDVPAGKKLFLTISSFSDMSFGHGSRAPGVLVLTDMELRVPIVPQGAL